MNEKKQRGGARPGAGRKKKLPENKPALPPAQESRPTPAIDATLAAEKVPRQDLRMMEQAARNRWNVPKRLRRKILGRMETIIDNCPDEKYVIGAAKVVQAADTIDQRHDQMESGKKEANVNFTINVEITQQQAELAALAAEVRTQNVVDAVPERPAIEHSGPA